MAEKNVQNDFSKGNIPAVVMRMALPLIAAQLVNVLYNVVDRIYIGHIPNVGSMALTGVGIALPVISILSAFAGLFGQGGAPLCSMARGRGDNDEAARVMGNAFSMLLVSSVALGLLTWAFLDPVITVFAAGKEASSYAREYLAVYLIGTTFSFVSLGMNVYINAQGFATRGMLTVLLGAAVFSMLVWAVFMLFPEPLIRIFTPDEELIAVAVRAVRIYFCGFVFMSLQFVAQNSFRSLGKARQAIFFSLLRKIVLVVPLMLLLPGVFGLGADGVYWSEPISDLLGGGAAFTTLMLTVYRPLAKELKEETLCQN